MASCVGAWCLVLLASLGAVRGEVYNSSETCLMGAAASPYVSLDCTHQPFQGHIFVRRVFHGLTPTFMRCNRAAPASSCCPGPTPSRDCLFSTDEGLDTLRKRCNTYTGCDTTLTRATVGVACPAKDGGNLTYGSYSHYGLVEYSCINGGLMTDVCDIGTINRGRQRYLETNVFHKTPSALNQTCTCAVSTTCGQRLVFTALAFDLRVNKTTQQCLQKVVLRDGTNSSVSTSIGCGFGKGGNSSTTKDDVGETKIFETVSNMADFLLEILDAKVGTLLVRVTASEGVDVEVRCGRTVEQALVEDHQCAEDLPTTTTSTVVVTTSDSSTSTSTAPISERQRTTAHTTHTLANDTDGAQHVASTDNSKKGAIAGVVVAVAVLIVFLVIFLVAIWKFRNAKPQRDRTQEPTTAHVYAAQEILPSHWLEERGYDMLQEKPKSCGESPFPDAAAELTLSPRFSAFSNWDVFSPEERPETLGTYDNIINETAESRQPYSL